MRGYHRSPASAVPFTQLGDLRAVLDQLAVPPAVVVGHRGTGTWSTAFTRWCDGIEVIAVEPSDAIRARCSFAHVLPGSASSIPLGDHSVDAAWLSTVIHQLPDLATATRELHRVVRPGGAVLVRSAFAGRHPGITLVRFFPETIRVLDTYPSVADVEAAFATCGFTATAFERVPQLTAPSLRECVLRYPGDVGRVSVASRS